MQTECTAKLFEFEAVGRRAVVAQFDGGTITSNGGALFLGQVNRGLGLIRRFAQCFTDRRDQLYLKLAGEPRAKGLRAEVTLLLPRDFDTSYPSGRIAASIAAVRLLGEQIDSGVVGTNSGNLDAPSCSRRMNNRGSVHGCRKARLEYRQCSSSQGDQGNRPEPRRRNRALPLQEGRFHQR